MNDLNQFIMNDLNELKYMVKRICLNQYQNQELTN
jgi:hypothetical protein